MNYELAKQLKDAGFPDSEYWVIEVDGHTTINGHEDLHSSPTLSELIEACGERVAVWRGPNMFNATILSQEYNYDNDGLISASFENLVFSGDTPEEAVAKLYIELHGTSS